MARSVYRLPRSRDDVIAPGVIRVGVRLNRGFL
jgi:hypothetical protein